MGRRMADWIQSCGLPLNIGSWAKVCPYHSCAQVEPFFLPVQAFLLHFYDLPPSPYSDGGLPLSLNAVQPAHLINLPLQRFKESGCQEKVEILVYFLVPPSSMYFRDMVPHPT